MQSTVGIYMVSTVTLGPSGLDRSSALISGTGLSGEPFKNLSLTVKPTSNATNYRVDVYFDGEIEESHTYPDPADQGTICHMNFPEMIFAPNCGTNVTPAFVANKKFVIDEVGVSFLITNLSGGNQSFYVSVCFEEFDAHRKGKLPVIIGYNL